MSRKQIDCRDHPSSVKCTLTIAGEEDEVLRTAVDHAVSIHGHQNNSELRQQLRTMLKDENLSTDSESLRAS